MLVMGIDMNGFQDLLSINIVENESAASWVSIFTDLKLRGIEDIFISLLRQPFWNTESCRSLFPSDSSPNLYRPSNPKFFKIRQL